MKAPSGNISNLSIYTCTYTRKYTHAYTHAHKGKDMGEGQRSQSKQNVSEKARILEQTVRRMHARVLRYRLDIRSHHRTGEMQRASVIPT